LWTRALVAARSADSTGVETELDWAIKARLIDRYRQRTGAELADPRVARLELAYHDIGPMGLAGALENAGAMIRLTDQTAIDQAVVYPPKTTRAALRGRFCAAARAAGAQFTVDWSHLRLGGPNGEAIDLPDPFALSDIRVDTAVQTLTQEADCDVFSHFRSVIFDTD
jgi:proteasome accessory factor A